MNKYKVQAEIDIVLPTSKGRVMTTKKVVVIEVEANNENEAERILENGIAFDYKFNVLK